MLQFKTATNRHATALYLVRWLPLTNLQFYRPQTGFFQFSAPTSATVFHHT